MGNCFSLQEPDRDHFIPEQGVSSSRAPKQISTFLSSHVDKPLGEFWCNQTQMTDSCSSDKTGRLILKGTGCIPGTVENTVKKTVWKLNAVYYSDSPIRIECTKKNGFVIHFGAKSGILENFEKFLRQEISDGDFKDGIVLNNPDDYREIWTILTRGSEFLAIYT